MRDLSLKAWSDHVRPSVFLDPPHPPRVRMVKRSGELGGDSASTRFGPSPRVTKVCFLVPSSEWIMGTPILH